MRGLLIAATFVAGPWTQGFQELHHIGSVAVAPGSRAQAHWLWGMVPVALQHMVSSWTRTWNPRLLHWQVDSSSLSYQGSPVIICVCVCVCVREIKYFNHGFPSSSPVLGCDFLQDDSVMTILKSPPTSILGPDTQ